MDKNALMKLGVKKLLQDIDEPARHNAELEANGRHRKWFWNRKQDPYSVLPEHERRILKKVKSRAHLLDKGFSCCCCQIGLDPIIGLIPVVGDFLGVLLALNLVQTAMAANLPQAIVSRMVVNVAIDFLIGLVPIIGDLADLMYKCNTRNALLLENYLLKRQRQRQGEDAPLSALHTTKGDPAPHNLLQPKNPQHHPAPSSSKASTPKSKNAQSQQPILPTRK